MQKGCCKVTVLSRKKAVVTMLGLLAAVYLFCTPSGAVRLAVAASGHPLKAVTCQVMNGFVHSRIDEDQKQSFLIALSPFHIEQPVIDRTTAGIMENWVVYRIGLLCVSSYWGYC